MALNPPGYSRDYMRQYRAKHPEYRKHESKYFEKWYWGNQSNREHHKKRNRQYMADTRAFACVARTELRSLLQWGPRTARLIRSHIDIESASDARVARFYRKLMLELKHGDR